jgi:hypothetical protein
VELEPPPWQWEVSFTTNYDHARGCVWLGSLLLRQWALRLVLKDDSGAVVDVHYLREREEIRQGLGI